MVATLGPASWTEEMIPKMIESGVNIFRMNCSHRRGGQFEEVYPRIRKHAKALGKKVEVLGDLQGPKFRNGEIDPSIESGIVELVNGQEIEFGIMKNDTDFTTPTRMTMAATTEQVALVKGCFVGLEILLEDGIKAMEVTEIVSESEVKCKITRGGKHKARKGINVPDLEIECAALTAKDVEDAEYLLQLDPPCEYICISFPQKGADIQELIDIMDRMKVPADKRPKICPKIEKPQALTNLEEIMALSQSLMVARGDLGVEMGIERCIFAQKLMIRDAKRKGLYPIINATQMMESMIDNPVPTRAEAADVFNAVMDGADAVMLSGEAATGKYPCETVKAQAAIALEAESVQHYFKTPEEVIQTDLVAEAGNKKQETDDTKRTTLVVATLGPASWTEEMIPKMIESGVNIFRMNCSHRRGGQFEEVYPRIRKHAKALGKKVEVLGDLQGPKFRNGEIDPSIESGIVELVNGQEIEFGIMKNDTDFTTPTRMTMAATTEQVALVKGCFVGLEILLEDGIKAMEVTEIVSESEVKCKITRGGKHKARKGINVPDLEIECAALTAKDVEDAEYLLQLDPPCEYICISFPQKGADIQELIDIMDRMKVPADKRPKICPKIEKPQALTNLEEIMALSQSLMVARGDLGVEMGIERCIFAQKLMIRDAKRKGLYPIINATQMMESMIDNPVPTRAEAADVFNAVMDGADAVMLSGEAATGKYPCETVKAQAAIALEAESVKKFFSPALKAPQ